MPLPTPFNGTEHYLAAILEELRGLRADIQQRPPLELDVDTLARQIGQIIELREPKPALDLGLPEEISHQLDEAAGYRRYPPAAPPEPEKPAAQKRRKKG